MHDLPKIREASDCRNMAEVRHGVDALDRQIIALLAHRFQYMDAAARIKTDRSAVRDNDRKAQVIENAVAAARAAMIPDQSIHQIWDILVESSIAYELDAWEKLND
jgi:isochorismate pyruvate lyase